MNNRLFLEVTPIRRGIEGLRCELLMMRSRSTLLSVGGSYYAGFRVLLLTAGRGSAFHCPVQVHWGQTR